MAAGFNPMGEWEGGGINPAGDLAQIKVVQDIVPVRIINSQPIAVRLVEGFDKGADPTGIGNLFKKQQTATLSLFKKEKPPAGGPPGGGGAAEFVKGGLVLAALGEVKKTFIDPLLGAAKGGFDQGVSKGSGSETLSKSFAVLGTAVGVVLLPTVVRLSVEALALADAFEKFRTSKIFKYVVDPLIKPPIHVAEDLVDEIKKSAFGRGAASIIAPSLLTGSGRGRGRQTVTEGNNQASERNNRMADVLTSLRQSVGGHAAQFGLTDIRQAAQQAALSQDPIEARAQQKFLEFLEKDLPKALGDWSKTAENTDPKK